MRYRLASHGHGIAHSRRAVAPLLALAVLFAGVCCRIRLGLADFQFVLGGIQARTWCHGLKPLCAPREPHVTARSKLVAFAASSETSRLDSGSDARLAARGCLLAAIPPGVKGAPVTNVTLSAEDYAQIMGLAADLEATVADGEVALAGEALARLDGDWRLVFSDAREITRLIKLPLGFRLGQVFQPIRVSRGYFENQAAVRHRFGLARASTRVVANFSAAELGTKNRVGVVNKQGNRINVRFQNVVFTLHRFLGLPTFDRIRKVATPRGPAEMSGKIPTLDVTYLDDKVRIGRGGDGSLFVLVREESPTPVLSDDEAAVLAPTTPKSYNAAKDILPGGQGGDGSK